MTTSSAEEKAKKLTAIAQEIEALTDSSLYNFRIENNYQIVFGEGDPDAQVVFIGEAPGKKEAETGRPFVGASGRVLDAFLTDIGLNRSDVYITNVVKDRPPNNRDPKRDEIALYTPFLLRQLHVIQPSVIATLGRFAMDYIFNTFEMPQRGQKISRIHGQPLTTETDFGSVSVLPLYHPAVALYAASKKEILRQDFYQLHLLLS